MTEFMKCFKCQGRVTPVDLEHYNAGQPVRCESCRTVYRRRRADRGMSHFQQLDATIQRNNTFYYHQGHLGEVFRRYASTLFIAYFLQHSWVKPEANFLSFTVINGVVVYQDGKGNTVRQRPARWARQYLHPALVKCLVDSDFEQFNNMIVAETKEKEYTFLLATGEDIRKFYNRENYGTERGPLAYSCMSGKAQQKYLNIYTENPNAVALLVAVDENEKVFGRCLVWTATTGKKYYDRIYGDDVIQRQMEIQAKDMGFSPIGKADFDVQMENWLFKAYPHVDSMGTINLVTGLMSGRYARDGENNRELAFMRSTNGALTAQSATSCPCGNNNYAARFSDTQVYCYVCGEIKEVAPNARIHADRYRY